MVASPHRGGDQDVTGEDGGRGSLDGVAGRDSPTCRSIVDDVVVHQRGAMQKLHSRREDHDITGGQTSSAQANVNAGRNRCPPACTIRLLGSANGPAKRFNAASRIVVSARPAPWTSRAGVASDGPLQTCGYGHQRADFGCRQRRCSPNDRHRCCTARSAMIIGPPALHVGAVLLIPWAGSLCGTPKPTG